MVNNEIVRYFNCRKCIEELPPGTTPQEYTKIDVGYTSKGVQVWCVRHNINIVHIEMETPPEIEPCDHASHN